MSAHELPVRIYYEDTDAAGIVYHANYLKFAERGRTEFLRSVGFDHRVLADTHGLVFAVSRCVTDFVTPARLELDQTVLRDGAPVARLAITLAILGRTAMRPKRLPEPLRRAFGAAVDSVEEDKLN